MSEKIGSAWDEATALTAQQIATAEKLSNGFNPDLQEPDIEDEMPDFVIRQTPEEINKPSEEQLSFANKVLSGSILDDATTENDLKAQEELHSTQGKNFLQPGKNVQPQKESFFRRIFGG